MIEIYRDSLEYHTSFVMISMMGQEQRLYVTVKMISFLFNYGCWLLIKRPGALTTGMAFISTSYTNSSI